MIIGVDTGGTFTDFVVRDEHGWKIYKVLSTPHDPAEAIMKGIAFLAGDKCGRVIHGSTVATNAMLERKWAKTALVTNHGFEDIIEISRQNRPELYSLSFRKQPSVVPRELRFGVSGRIVASGAEIEVFDQEEAQAVAREIVRSGAEAVAVCFLFSFLNPEHEVKMGQALAHLGIPVSLSHRILAEFREYERLSTTAVNACVAPVMSRYLNKVAQKLEGKNLSIMQSNGGQISLATATREPVRTILSGPAGGVVGAWKIGSQAGYNRLITFDMGGTSTDVALLDGVLPLTTESTIAGYPIKVPVIDIHTVGAGGGSIAYIDRGGALKVGPQSAGAFPGPVCYGKGNEITVTDANFFLGRLIPEHFLGGSMKLDRERLLPRLQALADGAGISPEELAEGICTVTNAAMERAIRVISVERGYDPREFTLLSFGGAGGMHAVFLARLLGIPRVLVPKNPGILSATGMAMADVIRDYSVTAMLTGRVDNDYLEDRFQKLEQKGRQDMAGEGINMEQVVLEHYLDIRYRGQSYELTVPFGVGFREQFHRQHQQRYGYSDRDKEVEIVNLRLRVSSRSHTPELEREDKSCDYPEEAARLGEREVLFALQPYRATLYDRGRLHYGNMIEGPAIIVEYSSTTVLPPESWGWVDQYGNLSIGVSPQVECCRSEKGIIGDI